MTSTEPKRVHCHVAGRVQGVWYRASTQKVARALRLSGWVRNLADGRVELVAEGRGDAVERLVAWLAEGPPGARIERVDRTDEDPTGRNGDFEILY
jgi:acylphosphatase